MELYVIYILILFCILYIVNILIPVHALADEHNVTGQNSKSEKHSIKCPIKISSQYSQQQKSLTFTS